MTDVPQVPTDSAALPSGAGMPLLGFGTWQLHSEAAVSATAAALEAGYRHIDTAAVYDNEGEVGRALKESGVPRDDVFVTTKCPPNRAGRELDTLEESLDLLGIDHVDLWLIHWPTEGLDRPAMWRAFIEARDQGLACDIGVSNFDATMLDEVTVETGVQPAVHPIEWSPLLFDREVLDEHRSRGVVLEGYSALRKGAMDAAPIRRIAEDIGRTPAQVILRWHLQHGVVVIPKSATPERIRANLAIAAFSLTADEVARVDALARG